MSSSIRASLSEVIKRHCGLMASALDFGSSDPGSSSGRDHCVVFLGQCLSIRECKWMMAICQEHLTQSWGYPCDGLASHPGVV